MARRLRRAPPPRPLPACPAGEGVPRSGSRRTASPAGRAGRGRKQLEIAHLAAELLHLPDEPAGVLSPARFANVEKKKTPAVVPNVGTTAGVSGKKVARSAASGREVDGDLVEVRARLEKGPDV